MRELRYSDKRLGDMKIAYEGGKMRCAKVYKKNKAPATGVTELPH